MAFNSSTCGKCSLRQTTKTSEHWCPECQEALCNECTNYHNVMKATRSHKPVPISKHKLLPSVTADIQQSCIYHNKQYQHYCVKHALPICVSCINDHRKCNVTTLENVTNNVKTSGHFLDLESRLDDLLQNTDRMKKDSKANCTYIEKVKAQHVKTIKQIRVELNRHLDAFEKQVLRDLEEKEVQCKENIQKVLSTIEDKEVIISQYHSNFQSIKQCASDLQIFRGIGEIEVKVNKYEAYLHSLVEAKGFEHCDLVFKVNTDVQSILHATKHFGSTEIKVGPNNFEFYRAKYKQSQLRVVGMIQTINDVKLILQKKYGGAVTGCCVSEVGEFLFIDNCSPKMLHVISSDGSLKFNMTLDSCDIFDIVCIDKKTVAITTGQSLKKTGIYIIDLEKRIKTKYRSLLGRSYGITRDQYSLFVCVAAIGIFQINIVNHTSNLIGRKLSLNSYVSVLATIFNTLTAMITV